MKNVRRIPIDDKLMECINAIWNDIQNGSVACSSDLYQNDCYCGGYEGDLDDIESGEFTFSKYNNKTEECWISIPYTAIKDVINGNVISVMAYDPE